MDQKSCIYGPPKIILKLQNCSEADQTFEKKHGNV